MCITKPKRVAVGKASAQKTSLARETEKTEKIAAAKTAVIMWDGNTKETPARPTLSDEK